MVRPVVHIPAGPGSPLDDSDIWGMDPYELEDVQGELIRTDELCSGDLIFYGYCDYPHYIGQKPAVYMGEGWAAFHDALDKPFKIQMHGLIHRLVKIDECG